MLDSAFIVLILMALFSFSHILLGLSVPRSRLVSKLGKDGFALLFYLVAESCFAILLLFLESFTPSAYNVVEFNTTVVINALLHALNIMGLLLVFLGLQQFSKSPVLVHKGNTVIGISRISRHPFFCGLLIISCAHIPNATSIVWQLFFVSLALYTSIGMYLQDKKLLARHGDAYGELKRSSSIVPFLAIIQGKQHLKLKELRPKEILVSIVLLIIVVVSHPYFYTFHGTKVIIIALIIGPAIEMYKSRERKGEIEQ